MMRTLVLMFAAVGCVPGAAFAQRDDGLSVRLDVPYAETENPRQRLDLFVPKEPKAEKLPVIVFIHGGAWMNGDKKDHAGKLMPFVRSGEYAGVSIGYRLTGEATWPAQIHDCKAAIRWVRANAAEHGLDPDRIGVWGTSAGAHLASMLGVTGDGSELDGDLGSHDDAKEDVACVVNCWGPSELLTMSEAPSRIDHTAPDSPESRLVGGPILERDEVARQASPVTHVSKDDAPVLTIHGTKDDLVPYDQGVRFDRALDRAGVASDFVTVPEGGHGGFRGGEMERRIEAYFAKHLLGRPVEVSTESFGPGMR